MDQSFHCVISERTIQQPSTNNQSVTQDWPDNVSTTQPINNDTQHHLNNFRHGPLFNADICSFAVNPK